MSTPSWQLEFHESLPSTSDAIRDRPVWSAIRAGAQSRGRGRYGRSWQSAPGGLWLSASVPLVSGPHANDPPSATFSLALGFELVRWMRTSGLRDARLRWPNDILIARRKVAGMIVDCIWPDRMVIGLGINVLNPIDSLEGMVETPPARLADHLPTERLDLEELASTVLDVVRSTHATFQTAGFEAFRSLLNAEWSPGTDVLLDTAGGPVRGCFVGVTEDGSPVLEDGMGGVFAVPGGGIRRFREV